MATGNRAYQPNIARNVCPTAVYEPLMNLHTMAADPMVEIAGSNDPRNILRRKLGGLASLVTGTVPVQPVAGPGQTPPPVRVMKPVWSEFYRNCATLTGEYSRRTFNCVTQQLPGVRWVREAAPVAVGAAAGVVGGV